MNWADVVRAAPDLATKVQARFNAHGVAILATLRRDGSPRISGIETLFGAGELWLGMMPGSLKVNDLSHDPRLALHSATVDKEVKEGDAKLSALAVPVQDQRTFSTYLTASGAPPSTKLGSFQVFRLDVKEMSYLIPAGDHLDIEWWNERKGYRAAERR